MKLIIAEKPDLAKAIAAVIEGDPSRKNGYIQKGAYTITWAYGHLFHLQAPEDYDESLKTRRMEDLPIYFENWKITPDPDKTEQLSIIKGLLQEADEVIHAGDPDDEGQLLIDEILGYYAYRGPVKRLLINDNNPAAVRKSLTTIEDNAKYYPLGRAAYARSVSDFIVGINCSRYFSIINNANLSIGRVQTPTLGLVVQRDLQIEQHIAQHYFTLQAAAMINDQEVMMTFTPEKDHPDLTDGKFLDQTYLNQLADDLIQNKYEVTVTKITETQNPPLPFNLAKLQIYANKEYGYSPADTLAITQRLRDLYKAITYNRSDCQYLSEEHYEEAPQLLPVVLQNLCLRVKPDLNFSIRSKCFNEKNVTAHHAIIPTNTPVVIGDMRPEDANIYKAICLQYVIQFLPAAQYEKYIAVSTISGSGVMQATAKRLTQQGYLHIFDGSEGDGSDEELDLDGDCKSHPLYVIEPGTYPSTYQSPEILKRETTPPKRYTAGTLLNDMTHIARYVSDPQIRNVLLEKDKDKKGESGSIGTPATRDKIIETLLKRNYIVEKGKQIISTPLGREFYAGLPDKIKKADMTAEWWLIQEEIKSGHADPDKLIHNVLQTVTQIVKDKNTVPYRLQSAVSMSPQHEALSNCPRCGKPIYEGKTNYYCSGYKDSPPCKFALFKESKFWSTKGKQLTATMVKNLLKNGKIQVSGLQRKDGSGTYTAAVSLDDTGDYVNYKMTFNDSGSGKGRKTKSSSSKKEKTKEDLLKEILHG